ncbi:MAG: hypothetical protein Q4A74_07075 [Cardiobacteriaceae bacterium]|nr:hypothetical protein [Cardiobacteriaceae bacterium]
MRIKTCCYALASLISLYFGASFVYAVIYRGAAPISAWLLALATSLTLAALPWLWVRFQLHISAKERTGKPLSIQDQMIARAYADLAALRENAVQYRSRSNNERIGLLLEQLCNHSEAYLHELHGHEDKIRANRSLLTVYLPELAQISLLYLQLPVTEISERTRQQLLKLIDDTHHLVQNGHQNLHARTLHDLETRMEVLRERLDAQER